MIFSGKDYREAFTEIYEYGAQNAQPLDDVAVNAMFGDLNQLIMQSKEDPENGKLFLKRELMKAVVAYLHNCFKKEGG